MVSEKRDKNKWDGVCRFAVVGCIASMTAVICAAAMVKHGGDGASVLTTVVAAGVVFISACGAACFAAQSEE